MSRGLGQGELLEPAPTRRLIVRKGRTAVWGVDPSTVRVAIASVGVDGVRGVSTRAFSGSPGPERLAGVRQGTFALVGELISYPWLDKPGLIVVEQPSGTIQNLQFVYAVGVIVATLQESTDCVIEYVTSAEWKKESCGYGAIKKPKREPGKAAPKPEDYAVLRWARENGYDGTSWDEADAWGIAEWARRTFVLEVR